MTTINFEHWGYERARERQLQLIQVAAQQRLLRAVQPASKHWLNWLQPLAFLRTWRLGTRWLKWSSPVAEAPCN